MRNAKLFVDPVSRPLPSISPPQQVSGFYRYFVNQLRAPMILLFTAGLLVALLDTAVPIFMGEIASLMRSSRSVLSLRSFGEVGLFLALVCLGRPLALLFLFTISNQIVAPALSCLVIWQSHLNLLRRHWEFFQAESAGRLTTNVVQTGHAVRDSVISSANAVWYICVYGAASAFILFDRHWLLILPQCIWAMVYASILLRFVPSVRLASRETARARSALAGRVVDTYSHIQLIKLYATPPDDDSHVREGTHSLFVAMRVQARVATQFSFVLALLNGALFFSATSIALALYRAHKIEVDVIVTTLSSTWILSGISTWVAQSVSSIFDNAGTVAECASTIGVQADKKALAKAETNHFPASPLDVEFMDVTFKYAESPSILQSCQVRISAGEHVGLVGCSGAGKSTFVNLLLGFYEPTHGGVFLGGVDIRILSERARAHFAVASQESAMLDRSIRENICLGCAKATDKKMRAAAETVGAHEFIASLRDPEGRVGYDAHVGERGVRLSGGQRQRIGLARAVLREASILVLDEATSALDAASEHKVLTTISSLFRKQTLILISHRLSAVAHMDRILVLEQGRIRQAGSHEELLSDVHGLYNKLWQMQTLQTLTDCDIR